MNYEGDHAWLHQRPVYAVSPREARGPVGLSWRWRLTHGSTGGFFLTSFAAALTDGQMWQPEQRQALSHLNELTGVPRYAKSAKKKNSRDINIAVTSDFLWRPLWQSIRWLHMWAHWSSHHWRYVFIFARFCVVSLKVIYCIQNGVWKTVWRCNSLIQ